MGVNFRRKMFADRTNFGDDLNDGLHGGARGSESIAQHAA
jgi:hypothetical protein